MQKYPFAARRRARAVARPRARRSHLARRAEATLDGERNLIDPVWGGMYQYSVHGDWHHPHYEKITAIQAGAIQNFALAQRGRPARRTGSRPHARSRAT